ncbi:MFS transporter [Streptomyces albus]|uniref:MFS transporter n=1 Tax=Streptomyces albus TaxID=1888 RepID=UPI0033EA9E79
MLPGSRRAEELATPLRRNRDYQMWWSGAAASNVGSYLLTVAAPLLVLETSGSAGQAGIVAGAAAVAKLAGSSPAGTLVDLCSRRALLFLASALQILAAVSLFAALLTGARGDILLAHLTVAVIVEGLGYSLHTATELPLLRKIVSEGQRRAALSREQSRKAAAQLAGPPLGGLLFSWSPVAPFLAAAVLFLGVISVALALRVPLGPARRARTRTGSMRGPRLAGLRYVCARRYLRYMLVWFALVNGAFAGLGLLLVVLCHDRGAAPAEIGFAQAAGSAGAVLGAVACEWLTARMAATPLLKASSWLLVAGAVAMAVPASAVITGIAYAVALFLTPAVNVSFMHHLVHSVPDELTGRISMAMMTAARSLNWCFAMGAGAMADLHGPLFPLFSLAGLFLVLACANHVWAPTNTEH